MSNTNETLQTAAQQDSASALVQRDAAAHNAIVGLQSASQKVSDFYGRQLVEKQREIFGLQDSVRKLEEQGAAMAQQNAELTVQLEASATRAAQLMAAIERLPGHVLYTHDNGAFSFSACPAAVDEAPVVRRRKGR